MSNFEVSWLELQFAIRQLKKAVWTEIEKILLPVVEWLSRKL